MHLYPELFRKITKPFAVIVPLWLRGESVRGHILALLSRWISAWTLILCLLVPSLVPWTTLFTGVWWGHVSSDTLSFTPTAGSTGHFQGLLTPGGTTLLFFQSSFIATRDSFAKCMQAVKVRHWQLVSYLHYSSFTGNFPSACGGIHSVIPLKNWKNYCEMSSNF